MLNLRGWPLFLAGVALESDSELFFGSPAKQNVVEDVDIHPTTNCAGAELLWSAERPFGGAVDR